MEKIDLRKELKYLYAPSAKKVEVVDVPAFNFAMLDGQLEAGQPPAESPVFQEALTALYGISYTLKFTSKLRKVDPIDYAVMALEGLWWVDSGEFDFNSREPWKWTLLMMQPDHITPEMFQDALEQVTKKRPNPALSRMRLESFAEGTCMQIMHLGPYSEETHTIEKMNAFARSNGYTLCGKHHEIYLGDPRRAKPEKLKTVLRHPIQKA
ncbi:MAG: hypothetical protein GYA59_13980 [Chloroflexi bacterium]|nr:hypothetical protein [Chloroflexota bacterium]